VTRDPSGKEDLRVRYDAPNGSTEAQQKEAIIEVAGSIRHADLWLHTGKRQPHILGTARHERAR
jgi:hypothetical protein